MLHEPYGPRGAEDERDDFPEGPDTLPGGLPGDEIDPTTAFGALGTPGELTGMDPFTPAVIAEGPMRFDTARSAFEREADGVSDADEAENEDVLGALGPDDEDPLGSWTGVPDEADETPTQDADDL